MNGGLTAAFCAGLGNCQYSLWFGYTKQKTGWACTICTGCADGKFKTGTSVATSCEDKKTETDCSTSDYFTAGDKTEKAKDDTTCTTCNDGEFKTDTSAATACANKKTANGCAVHQKFLPGANDVKHKDDTTCETCAANWFPNPNNKTECTPCDAGKYKTGDSSECTPCPACPCRTACTSLAWFWWR